METHQNSEKNREHKWTNKQAKQRHKKQKKINTQKRNERRNTPSPLKKR